MFNRRKFIRNASALAAGSLLLPHIGCGDSSQTDSSQTDIIEKTIPTLMGKPYGVQLYTLRSKFPLGFAEEMKKLAQIGYTELESFAQRSHYCGVSLKEYKTITQDLGLKTISSHIRTGRTENSNQDTQAVNNSSQFLFGSMTQNLPAIIDTALEMGQSYLVLAYLEEFEYRDIDAWNQTLDLCLSVADECKNRGIKFCYHNHDFEFLTKDKDGNSFYDFLLNNSEGSNLNMELDLYWVHKAGEDPIQYFQKYPGRFPLWHVKDMDNTPEKGITEVGNGVIDFTSIFENAEAAGMEHFFVEQDRTPGEPIQSLMQSFENLSLTGM